MELSSSEALPLSSRGWVQASCFPRVASCFAHQEAALAPLLKSWQSCWARARELLTPLGPGSPFPSQPDPFCLPLTCRSSVSQHF